MRAKERSGIPRERSLKRAEHLSAYICEAFFKPERENGGHNEINLFPHRRKLTLTPLSGSSPIVLAGRRSLLMSCPSSSPVPRRPALVFSPSV